MRYIILFWAMLIIALPIQAQIDPNPDLETLWRQVRLQPEDFAVACLPLEEQQSPVLYNLSIRHPLASVTKVMILIEFANQVTTQRLDPTERIPVEELNRYALRRTDMGSHDRFLATYDDNIQWITLWDIATIGMIDYSSNPASDYVLARLGDVDWENMYRVLGLTATDYPHPLTTIPFLMNNHEMGQATWDDVPNLSLDEANDLLEQYLDDTQWRNDEIAYRAERRRNFPSWAIQTAILQDHTANGTVYDLMLVMQAIYSDISPLANNTKALVRQALRWDNSSLIDSTYFEYGSKLGFYSGGTLTLVAYGNPYNSDPIISVAFFRKIPSRTYFEMLREDSIGLFAHYMNLNGCDGLLENITGE